MNELLFGNINEKEALENILALNQIKKCDEEIIKSRYTPCLLHDWPKSLVFLPIFSPYTFPVCYNSSINLDGRSFCEKPILLQRKTYYISLARETITTPIISLVPIKKKTASALPCGLRLSKAYPS